MQFGSVIPSPEQLARQRFAMLLDACEHGGLVLQELASGDWFVCVNRTEPDSDTPYLFPVARMLTGAQRD